MPKGGSGKGGGGNWPSTTGNPSGGGRGNAPSGGGKKYPSAYRAGPAYRWGSARSRACVSRRASRIRSAVPWAYWISGSHSAVRFFAGASLMDRA